MIMRMITLTTATMALIVAMRMPTTMTVTTNAVFYESTGNMLMMTTILRTSKTAIFN